METYYIGEEHLDEDDDDTVLSDPVDHTPESEGSTYQYAAISTTVTLRPTANIYLLNVSDRTGSQLCLIRAWIHNVGAFPNPGNKINIITDTAESQVQRLSLVGTQGIN